MKACVCVCGLIGKNDERNFNGVQSEMIQRSYTCTKIYKQLLIIIDGNMMEMKSEWVIIYGTWGIALDLF